MTRRMADAVTVANLPTYCDLYAAYLNGRFANYAEVRNRFPGKTVIAITVTTANIGDCLDVEQGDATPAQAPGWVLNRRVAGHRGPLVYCSEAMWGAVRAAFAAKGVPEPGYWIAGYPGSVGPTIYPGAIGHQWIDHNGLWDESIMADHLPGIDPDTTTEDEMSPDFAIRLAYRVCLHREADGPGYATYMAQAAEGKDLGDIFGEIQDSPEGQAVLKAERKALGLV